MSEPTQEREITFDTSQWYAIFAGWLIFPAVFTLFAFLGAIIMFLFVDPSELSGFDLVIYYADVVTIPYLIIVYIVWFKRKRIFPHLMVIYFLFAIAVNVSYFIYGYQLDVINLAMAIVWIFYFTRSKRVKATFVEQEVG